MGNCSKKTNRSSITGITVNKLLNNFIRLITFPIIEHWLPAFIRSFLLRVFLFRILITLKCSQQNTGYDKKNGEYDK